jgi:hypothetical protein
VWSFIANKTFLILLAILSLLFLLLDDFLISYATLLYPKPLFIITTPNSRIWWALGIGYEWVGSAREHLVHFQTQRHEYLINSLKRDTEGCRMTMCPVGTGSINTLHCVMGQHSISAGINWFDTMISCSCAHRQPSQTRPWQSLRKWHIQRIVDRCLIYRLKCISLDHRLLFRYRQNVISICSYIKFGDWTYWLYVTCDLKIFSSAKLNNCK